MLDTLRYKGCNGSDHGDLAKPVRPEELRIMVQSALKMLFG
jgi:hypothetical protein